MIALSTGGAYAANTIGSSDIINGQVKTADIGNAQVRDLDIRDEALSGGGLTGDDIYGLTGDDIASESLTGTEIANGSLTGAEVADQSGVDTCTHGTVRFGELCVGVANVGNTWFGAVDLCADLNLRLPSYGEGVALARNFDLPNAGQAEHFWTEEQVTIDTAGPTEFWSRMVNDGGIVAFGNTDTEHETVCVTTPTN